MAIVFTRVSVRDRVLKQDRIAVVVSELIHGNHSWGNNLAERGIRTTFTFVPTLCQYHFTGKPGKSGTSPKSAGSDKHFVRDLGERAIVIDDGKILQSRLVKDRVQFCDAGNELA